MMVRLQRAPDHSPFTREELNQFNQLIPHVQRAIQMRQRFTELQLEPWICLHCLFEPFNGTPAKTYLEIAIMRGLIGLRQLLLAASLSLPGIGFAVDAPAELAPSVEGGIAYVSGGVGKGEQQAIKDMRKDYNLQLLFAAKDTGEYLADVAVKIQDGAGKKVFETVSAGPFFLAKLPPEKYQVTADFHGKPLTRSVSVQTGGILDLNFSW